MSTSEEGAVNVQVPSERTRKFHARSTALEVLEGIDLSGKTFLITGTTAGIGTETARALALKGAHVVMANRNILKSEAFRDKILAEKADAKIDLITCDLDSLQSVTAAAKEFCDKHWPLHGLILNAGVFAPANKTTFDGFETAFGVNHLCQFQLLVHLLPVLRQSQPSRVVFVTSVSSKHTGLDPNQPIEEKLKKLMPTEATENFYKLYSYSKMCNVLTALKLHRDEHDSGISTYAVHPGTMIGTDISRTFGVFSKVLQVLSKPFTKNLEQGAATSVYCAASPEVSEVSGKFWESCWDDESNLHKAIAHDTQLQDKLWEQSENLISEWERKQQPIVTLGTE